jgi:hypothetical protein
MHKKVAHPNEIHNTTTILWHILQACKGGDDVIAHSCSPHNPEMGKGGNASMVKNRSPAREANRCRKVTQIRGQVSNSYGCSFNIFLPELEYVDA